MRDVIESTLPISKTFLSCRIYKRLTERDFVN